MQDWLALTGLIFAGSISPGPNNALALRAGVARDWSASLAVIAGVQFGCLVLFALSSAGLAVLLETNRRFAVLLTIAGASYLAWLGLVLMRGSGGDVSAPGARLGVASVAWLQFVNPKAWILVATVAGSTSGEAARLGAAVALFVAISATSLLAWSAAGLHLSRWISSPGHRLWFDRGMGALLIASAITLIASNVKGHI